MAEKSLKQIISEAANEFVTELKEIVPVRSGKLKAGLKYEVKVGLDGIKVLIISEDYLKWLRERTKPLPTNVLRWSGSVQSLPEMNSLPETQINQLSSRSKSILDSLNFEDYLDKSDLSLYYNKEIEKLVEVELK